MKQILHRLKNIRQLGAILLILLTAFFTSAASSQAPNRESPKNTPTSQAAIDKYLTAQQNADVSDEEKIKAAIDAYFTTRYEGQKSITEQDFSTLIEDDTLDWVKKEKDKREIELYIASLFDLGYESYKFTLEYDTIEIKGNKATVQVIEGHQVVFNSTSPEVSILANLKHIITLYNKKDSWVISKDAYQDELSSQISHTSKDEIKNQIDSNYQLLIHQKQNYSEIELNKINSLTEEINRTSGLISYNYSYDRIEAVRYADAHIPGACAWCGYNTTYYKTETQYGDCTNFVSQAIYAGGGNTPPDTKGMTTSANRNSSSDWYYVFNYSGPTSGSGSTPWIQVQAQRDFIISNSNKIGPTGYETTVLCNVSIGDIVQLKGVNTPGVWDHEGIIIQKSSGCETMSTTLVDLSG
ncbi:MAG TPA: amidase domain-containing protein [Anaerolineales bacterium]|nr:amidase domain-containing protein [Anaerolineales bacterium]